MELSSKCKLLTVLLDLSEGLLYYVYYAPSLNVLDHQNDVEKLQ